MTSGTCPRCGAPISLQAQFCGSCGSPTPSPAPPFGAPPGAPAPPTYAAPLPGGFPGGAGPFDLRSVQERPVDRRALRTVRWASVLGLVSSFVGLVALAVPGFAQVFSVTSTNAGPVLSTNATSVFGVYLAAAAVLGLVELFLYRSAYRTLTGVSREFSTPSTLSLLAIVGVLLALIGVGVLFAALVQAIHCVGPGNPLTSACLSGGGFWAAVALLVTGGLLAIVGFIGILIGLWRLGRRFDRSVFQLAAVLLIIPYVSIVGQILILVGTTQELGRTT